MRRLILFLAAWLALTVGALVVDAQGISEFEPHAPGLMGQDSCLVYDLREPCVAIPAEMALAIADVIQCESGWNVAALGAAGERGLLQVHPIHAGAMGKAGLDFGSERDRIAWAVVLFKRAKWAPWSCHHG